MSSSKECSFFKKEREIQKIKSEKNVSYGEARRLYKISNAPMTGKSYASAVKSTSSIATQTNLTWPMTETSPKPFKENNQSSQSTSTSSSQTPSTSSQSAAFKKFKSKR